MTSSCLSSPVCPVLSLLHFLCLSFFFLLRLSAVYKRFHSRSYLPVIEVFDKPIPGPLSRSLIVVTVVVVVVVVAPRSMSFAITFAILQYANNGDSDGFFSRSLCGEQNECIGESCEVDLWSNVIEFAYIIRAAAGDDSIWRPRDV